MRVIASCKGGPLDAAVFSVESEADTPGPLFGRYEVSGTLYVPEAPCPVPASDVLLFADDHEEAWSYVPSPDGERLYAEHVAAVENE